MKTITIATIALLIAITFGCGVDPHSNIEPIIDVDRFTKDYMAEKMQGVDTITPYEGSVCPYNCTKIQYNDRAYAILGANEKLVLFTWINDDSIPWDDQLGHKLGIGKEWHLVKDGSAYRKYMGENGYDIVLRGQDGNFNTMVINQVN